MTTANQIIALTFPLITAGILGVAGLVVRQVYGKKVDVAASVRAGEPVEPRR